MRDAEQRWGRGRGEAGEKNLPQSPSHGSCRSRPWRGVRLGERRELEGGGGEEGLGGGGKMEERRERSGGRRARAVVPPLLVDQHSSALVRVVLGSVLHSSGRHRKGV